ncbi:hypothetical protein M902_2698 [Bacteriovorax sp. BAL6_X]|uniref:FlxA-like family protein n=1 Tax=Bacteriovorax sp. BAL6_X TaxID=1201290 RepID=UPI00038658A9|nr:FlxA-like family protein [Bacteriovorax sp. BAL6_X]EPZ51343.1 hypothetical protein M902_2698 [Bacteriovorax sp. BAL6_X]
MKVVKSSIILMFTLNSVMANEGIGILNGSNGQAAVIPAGETTQVLDGSTLDDEVHLQLVEQAIGQAEKSVSIEQSLRRKRLQFFLNSDSLVSKVTPMSYDSNFLATAYMSEVPTLMSDFSATDESYLNFTNPKSSRVDVSKYVDSGASQSLFNSNWSNINFDFDQGYTECNPTIGNFSGNSRFLEGVIFDLGTRINGCSDEYLTLVDDGYNILPLIDTKKFCSCTSEFSYEDDVEKQLESDDLLNDFADNLYGKLVAHRMKNFEDFLKRSKDRFDLFDESKEVVDEYSCSRKNIAVISEKLKGCFGGSAASAIDKKLGLDNSKDTSSFLSNLISMGPSGKLGRSKDRMAQIFSKMKDSNTQPYGQSVSEEQKVKEFTEIFVLGYEKHSQGPLGFTREYINKLSGYIYNDRIMRGAYEDFRKKELDYMDSVLKAKESENNKSSFASQMSLEKQSLSLVQEDMLFLQFATAIFSKTLPRLLDGSSKASYADISKAFNELETESDEGVKAMGDIYNVIKGQHEQELRASCKEQIMLLEESCNESNAEEVMSSLSTEEFIAINEVNDGLDDRSINARKYCSALNKGLFKDSEVVVKNYALESQKGMDEIRSAYDPSNKLASKTRREVDESLGHSIGGFSERSSNAGDIINNGNEGTVANDTSSSDYNFDEAAQFLESYNNTSSSAANSNFTNSNVIDSNSLQTMIQNPSTSVKSLEDVRSKVEDEAMAVAKEIEESQNSTAVSTDEASQSAELKAELAALKAQIAELNSAITSKNENSDPTDELDRQKNAAIQRNRAASNFSGSSGFGGGRRDVNSTNNPRAIQQSTSGSSIPTNSSVGSTGSTSSVGAGVSGLSRLGATGGLGLTSGGPSSRASSGAVAGDNIAKSDQRLVAKAIAEGSNSVVLADGRIYYIGHDEEGNVILSETAEEVLASVPGPEQEGPQLPSPKAEDGVKREIASEEEDVKEPREDSIYSKFLDAAEISD